MTWDDMDNCAFCGSDKKHFQAHPKTKHYQLGKGKSARMVSTELDVMQCLKCKTRWIKYREIEKAVQRK